MSFPGGSVEKNLPANAGDTGGLFQSLGQEDLLIRKWQPAPVFLPGKSHCQRSLAGYRSWGHRELDTTERLIVTVQYVVGSGKIQNTQERLSGII